MLKIKEIISLLELITKKSKNQEKEIKELNAENLMLYEENKYLRVKIEDKKDLTNSIIRELYSNLKTDKQKIEKLKELISEN